MVLVNIVMMMNIVMMVRMTNVVMMINIVMMVDEYSDDDDEYSERNGVMRINE